MERERERHVEVNSVGDNHRFKFMLELFQFFSFISGIKLMTGDPFSCSVLVMLSGIKDA